MIRVVTQSNPHEKNTLEPNMTTFAPPADLTTRVELSFSCRFVVHPSSYKRSHAPVTFPIWTCYPNQILRLLSTRKTLVWTRGALLEGPKSFSKEQLTVDDSLMEEQRQLEPEVR